MRGKENRRMDRRFHTRITPAYAGKRAALANCRPCSQDHPRLCGEKSLGLTVYLHVSGSPPPMRGKAEWSVRSDRCERITPAYAGKRSEDQTVKKKNKDHPRLCGEKLLRTVRLHIAAGSPPPMRGKVRKLEYFNVCIGITPAYAGKSLSQVVIPAWD